MWSISGCLYIMTRRTHSSVRYVPVTHRPHSSVRYVPVTHRPHSSVRYVPTALCFCRFLSRVWRRIRKATKLTRTVLLFILRPNASFAIPPSYTLVCALLLYALRWISVAGLYTPCCGFLRTSIRPVAGLYALCCRFLCRLVLRWPCAVEG